MAVDLSDAKRKANSVEINTTATGTTVTEIYMIQAATAYQAQTASGVPVIGDEFPEFTDATVQEVDVTSDTNAPDTANSTTMWYNVEVRYRTPNAGTTDPTDLPRPEEGSAPLVRFSQTVQSQRIEVDAEDASVQIGDPHYWSNFSQQFFDEDTGLPLENPDAEIGLDVLVPNISFEVIMPESSIPPPLDTYAQFTGTCNSKLWQVGADAANGFSGYLIPPEYALYTGAEIERLASGKFGVNHSFSVGVADLPPNTPTLTKTQAWNSQPWQGGVNLDPLKLPIRYGYFTRFRRIETQNSQDATKTDVDIFPQDLRIVRLYKVNDFALMGVGTSFP